MFRYVRPAGAFGDKVVGLRRGVATELREHIGPGFHVIQRAQVTAIVERTQIFILQSGKSETRFLLCSITLRFISSNFASQRP